MSIEPTCEICGASDKNRCRSLKESMTCENTRTCEPMPRPTKIPKLSLTSSMGVGEVTVATHQAGVKERLNVSIERDKHGSGPVNFTIHADSVESFINLLKTAQNYAKKGTI